MTKRLFSVVVLMLLGLGLCFLTTACDKPYDNTIEMPTYSEDFHSVIYLDVGEAGSASSSAELLLDSSDLLRSAEIIGAEQSEVVMTLRSLIGKPVEEALRTVLTYFMQSGLLSSSENTLLVSLASPEQNRLFSFLTQSIPAITAESGFAPSLILMPFEPSDELTASARKQNLSPGRLAAFSAISSVLTQSRNPLAVSEKIGFSTEDLLSRSLHTVNLFLHCSQSVLPETLRILGAPSMDAFFSDMEALSLALSHARLSKSALSSLSFNFRFLDLELYYEFHFSTKDTVCFYWVNASSGEILDAIQLPADKPAPVENYFPSSHALHFPAENDRGYILVDYCLSEDHSSLMLLWDGSVFGSVPFTGNFYPYTLSLLDALPSSSSEAGAEDAPPSAPTVPVLVFSYYRQSSGESEEVVHKAFLADGESLPTLAHKDYPVLSPSGEKTVSSGFASPAYAEPSIVFCSAQNDGDGLLLFYANRYCLRYHATESAFLSSDEFEWVSEESLAIESFAAIYSLWLDWPE